MDYESKKTFLINTAFTVTILFIIYFLSKFMLSFLLPFVFAFLFSFLAAKLSSAVCLKFNFKENVLRIILLLTFYLLFVLVAFFIIFLTLKYSGNFLSEIKTYIASPYNIFYALRQKVSDLSSLLPENLRNTADITTQNFSKKAISAVTDFISGATMSVVKFLPRFFISSIITVVASFYITKDYNRLKNFLKLMLGEQKYSALLKIKNILTGSVLKLFSGYLILSAITFMVVFVSFLCFSVRHSFIFSLIIGFVDLLPVLGTGAVLIPAALLNFINEKTTAGVLLLALYISITLLRNFLEPKIISDRLNINPLLMLITLFIGLKIGGVIGMLLLPLSAVVTVSYYKTK